MLRLFTLRRKGPVAFSGIGNELFAAFSGGEKPEPLNEVRIAHPTP